MPPFKPSSFVRKTRPVQPLADLVGGAINPTLARHGFGEADVLLHWAEIVGADLAGRCQPVRMQWRSRRAASPQPATLVVRVESGSALVLQHMEQIIVERLNHYLGWRCVGGLALRQGPVTAKPRRRPQAAAPEPRLLAEAAHSVADIDDPGLRDVLARLGARVLERRGLRES